MSKIEMYRPYIEKICKEYLGLEELIVDDNGDIPIRLGSSRYIVRLIDDPMDLVRVFAVAVYGATESPELYKELNRINSNIVSARIFYLEGNIVAVSETPAESCDKEDFAHLCWAVGTLADGVDQDLQKQFGGELAFKEEEGDGKDVSVDV